MIGAVSEATVTSFFSYDCATQQSEESSDSGRRIGRIAFCSFAFIGGAVAIGANRKKRRSVELAPGHSQLPPLPIIFLSDEQPEYDQLRCTNHDKKLIYEIIHPLGTETAMGLWAKEDELNRKGDILRAYVHTLKFLETIICHRTLRQTILQIFSSNGFIDKKKQEGFVGGIAWGMSHWAEQNRLYCYLDGFAQKLGIPADQIRIFIEQRNWHGLVLFLCQRSVPQGEQTSQESQF